VPPFPFCCSRSRRNAIGSGEWRDSCHCSQPLAGCGTEVRAALRACGPLGLDRRTPSGVAGKILDQNGPGPGTLQREARPAYMGVAIGESKRKSRISYCPPALPFCLVAFRFGDSSMVFRPHLGAIHVNPPEDGGVVSRPFADMAAKLFD
jgi:hypothetical protein